MMKLILENWRGFLTESNMDLANEEFFYEDLVLPIESELIEFIFDVPAERAREKTFVYEWPYPVDPEEFDEDYSTSFYLVLKVYPVEDISAPINVAGNTEATEDGYMKIDVKVEYRPGTNLDDHRKDIVGQLRNTLAHEVHHLTQDQSLKRPECPFLPEQEGKGYVAYFTSACEVPAFVIGFRAEARHLNIPVKELMKSYLDNYVENGKLDLKDAITVYNSWSGHSFAIKQKGGL